MPRKFMDMVKRAVRKVKDEPAQEVDPVEDAPAAAPPPEAAAPAPEGLSIRHLKKLERAARRLARKVAEAV